MVHMSLSSSVTLKPVVLRVCGRNKLKAREFVRKEWDAGRLAFGAYLSLLMWIDADFADVFRDTT